MTTRHLGIIGPMRKKNYCIHTSYACSISPSLSQTLSLASSSLVSLALPALFIIPLRLCISLFSEKCFLASQPNVKNNAMDEEELQSNEVIILTEINSANASSSRVEFNDPYGHMSEEDFIYFSETCKDQRTNLLTGLNDIQKSNADVLHVESGSLYTQVLDKFGLLFKGTGEKSPLTIHMEVLFVFVLKEY